jgi:zinc/manganese transport system permease protein
MTGLLQDVIEPGFFSSEPVHVALVVGAVAALVSAVVGVFTVLRGQSFAGHALGDVGTTGGSGAFLVGVNPLWGFVTAAVVGAGIMELFGIRRQRGRDLATGIVLGGALGVAALFLYLDSNSVNTTGATFTVLFGSIFAINQSTVPVVVLMSLLALVTIGVLYRPLLLSSLNVDMACARGVPVRTLGVLYLLAMAVAVSLSCITIGAILSTALLIGPAAGALRLTKRPGLAMAWAALIGVASTWLGILLAYDSYYWPPVHRGWPVSFFVVTLIFLVYLVADISSERRGRQLSRQRSGRSIAARRDTPRNSNQPHSAVGGG